MLATLTIRMASTFDIQWVPFKLTSSIVSMPMKCTNHKAKQSIFGFLRQAAVLKRLRECTANIVSTTDFAAKIVNEPINNC
jgi:hypothetical protein